MELNDYQKAAVTAKGKPVLVSAGAGTGKTRVLVERFLDLLRKKEALIPEILAITFTEKAANEMKSRIRKRLRHEGMENEIRELETAWISTIHAFAARVLREHPLEAGVDPEFRVMEEEESDFLKEQILDEMFESSCLKGTAIFELIRIYGENTVRESVKKLHECCRAEGLSLDVFAAIELPVAAREPAAELFEALDEKELAGEVRAFEKAAEWDWARVEAFKIWKKQFSRKRGKKGDDRWQRVKDSCQQLLDARLEGFVQPPRACLIEITRTFEAAYAQRKTERSMLDFLDLENKVLSMLKKESRIHQKLRERYAEKFRQVMVDEFQDTNPLQVALVELIARPENLFIVGDYKQSIYAFRGAEPAVFREREMTYREGEGGQWIPLTRNYRSTAEVVDFVNRFFQPLWAEEGSEYMPLEPGRENPPPGSVEILALESESDEKMETARLREAEQIALRMRELHEDGTPYGDMAILFQAMTHSGIYEQALKRAGIPYYVLSGRGFYHQPEVRDLIQYLSCLENLLGDIPLAASLRSPLFQVSDDALFWMARYAKQDSGSRDITPPLWDGVQRFEEIPEISSADKEKIHAFIETTRELIRVKDRFKLTELLELVLEKTAYALTVLGDAQGIRRYANLRKLVQLAREFESFEPLPLAGFLKTVKRLQTEEARESEAQIEAEESGRVVRLLSIHRAKGLEFPVVFVADMGRKRQSPDSRKVTAERSLGFSMQVRNEKTFEWEKPARWRAIDEHLKTREKQERKRLFYVAATRACDRLVLSGVWTQKKKQPERFEDMSTWMEWVLAAGLEDIPCSEGHARALPRSASRDAVNEKISALIEAAGKDREKQQKAWLKVIPEEALEKGELLYRRIHERKPQASRAIDLPVSAFTSFAKDPEEFWRVYEIGYAGGEAVKREGVSPVEDAEPGLSAASFGTRMHTVLERLDFHDAQRSADLLLGAAFRGMGEDVIARAQKQVQGFLSGSLFTRLREAKRIYRELPFVLNERHGLIYGAVDVLFQDARGGWHVVDYKTGTGSEEAVRGSAYDLQIRIYALAASRLLGTEPAGGLLYFLENQWSRDWTWQKGGVERDGAAVKTLQEEILNLRATRLAGEAVTF